MKIRKKSFKFKATYYIVKTLFCITYVPLWLVGAIITITGQIALIVGDICFLDKYGAKRKIKNLKAMFM